MINFHSMHRCAVNDINAVVRLGIQLYLPLIGMDL